jgi:hypothetical protein
MASRSLQSPMDPRLTRRASKMTNNVLLPNAGLFLPLRIGNASVGSFDTKNICA